MKNRVIKVHAIDVQKLFIVVLSSGKRLIVILFDKQQFLAVDHFSLLTLLTLLMISESFFS